MGPLRDAHNLFKPLRMVITSWSDRSKADAEPYVTKNAQATYRLDVRSSGLRIGSKFTIFRSVSGVVCLLP